MASYVELIQKALKDNDLTAAQLAVREAFSKQAYEPVFRYYFKLVKKQDPKANVLRGIISWTGYRGLKDGVVSFVFAQPVLLLYTKHEKPLVPKVPPTVIVPILKELYQAERFKVLCSGVFFSPANVPIKNPTILGTLIASKTTQPILPEEKGWHFRFLPVFLEGNLPIPELSLQDMSKEAIKKFKDAVKHYALAEDVGIITPTEIFDLWIAYDVINQIPKELEKLEKEDKDG